MKDSETVGLRIRLERWDDIVSVVLSEGEGEGDGRDSVRMEIEIEIRIGDFDALSKRR